MNGIGQRLRQERKRLNLTQSALGAIGGVEANAQGHYESGHRMPRADYLFRIAAAGVDITRVVTGVDSIRGDSTSAPGLPCGVIEPGQELVATDSMVKIIGQLRESLWVTANALCEVTKMMGPEEHKSMSEPVEHQLRGQQGDANGLS